MGFKLAIAGMDVCLPGIDGLDGFERTLYRTLPLEQPVEGIRFDLGRPRPGR